MGRPASCNPARARRTAFDTAASASPWPTTRRPRFFSMASSLSRSPASILSTGMPVQRLTMEAMCSGVTASSSIPESPLLSAPSAAANCFSRPGMTWYCRRPASS